MVDLCLKEQVMLQIWTGVFHLTTPHITRIKVELVNAVDRVELAFYG